MDGLSFKIITKRKVAQHLKKGAVSCGFSYIFDITGTDTLLAGRHPTLWRNLLSGKIRFQRRHTGIDEQ